MSALNDRIAKAKGWVWGETERLLPHHRLGHFPPNTTQWCNSEGNPAMRPDFAGTVEGVAGMMRDLQERETPESVPDYDWALRWNPLFQLWDMWAVGGSSHKRLVVFQSRKEEGFGVAVGRAYLFVFGKEATNGD